MGPENGSGGDVVDRGQPTVFESGEVSLAFGVLFSGTLEWTLGDRVVTASDTVLFCVGEEPGDGGIAV